ncbi:hypothetical protein BJ138DRAFT_1105078 [Hygrophoropsis aurantiaca]|uniref:Uncharacterized protein n=1 Tax=Hygrophoropsis aurantiaca TaxID=72124 RepID=A0ACB7ZZ35_9AGAM|nr:hypothetical protein BJ138DRAFT_1105078 [Hygrophoropsis aurantiaca]
MSSELISNFYGCLSTSASKYHTRLLQILAINGGAGEIEEGMMWFASNYEKFEDKDSDDTGGVNGAGIGMNEEASGWKDWRGASFCSLSHYGVQIQILLYFLKLSLPCRPLKYLSLLHPRLGSALFPNASSLSLPTPSAVSESTPTASSAAHKKRKIKKKAKTIIPFATERLGSFMDKLPMWQLLRLVDTDPAMRGGGGPDSQSNESKPNGGRGKEQERDWISSPDILLLGISPLRPRAQPGAKAKLFDPSPSPPASPLARSAGRNEARSLKRVASTSMDAVAERAFDDAPTKAGSGLHVGKRIRIR